MTVATNQQTASPNVPPIDGIFRALADPTRRRVVERLNRSPASVGELAQPFGMALPSFIEHLKVLESCGLVRSQKTGRVRTYRLAPEPLKLAENWLTEQRALWERRLDQFDAYVMTLKEKDI
ncbi:metalloregulator ArsR/SmtB family transcription factor [Mesorhizobium sp.]|uniref:ArsR/SmtB family transcription factor n=1 Tax=Mesorhizobium sp. TaxID=1871066 RepID=UPI0012075C9E|nr:metalloregulator ArsR/SmtB family transcription factor [Mesorhizobium sp.]TIO08798.1 MAG: helix-turn-helix transcriptional regulator [Mesorhizobium sp.]TIO36317.1 MAG: helix-turn-helix transcriptional regulator [Mesorhizobium sp.]